MSEIEDGTPIEDTPQPDAPEGVNPGDTPEEGTAPDQAAPENWEARYKEAQAWGTRMAQERAQYEAQAALVNDLNSDDFETRKRAFEALGVELAEEEPTYDDPQDELAARLERLEQSLQQQNQASQQAQQIAQIEAHVDAQLAAIDGLSEASREWIVNTAVAMPPTPEGMPDIPAAYEKFKGLVSSLQQDWAQTKRAPAIRPGGQAGTKALPMDATHQQRVDYMSERLLADQ